MEHRLDARLFKMLSTTIYSMIVPLGKNDNLVDISLRHNQDNGKKAYLIRDWALWVDVTQWIWEKIPLELFENPFTME